MGVSQKETIQMSSSFAAQNHGSRNAHQTPVKSHKGGYLRCPFNISASYAELAEKRVREDLARGGGGVRGPTAVADKDGLLSSSSLSSPTNRRVDGDGGLEGSEGRPWSRAGVGASKLSSKEKRMQQEQAELIYGRGSLASGDADDATAGTASLSHGPSQENMFAVDSRDQATLQRVVPRGVREKVKRRRLEDVRQERIQLGHHTHRNRTERGSNDDERAGTSGEEAKTLPRASATPYNAKSTSAAPVTASKSFTGSNPDDVPAEHKSSRQSPAAEPPNTVHRSDAKPKNRMQMLDDLRSSALIGKKRRR
ncbi:hypothetical protein ABB37_02851 [Leptomonas pyrrhocoris]|uniref:Uncharacterized protein n=1 Tax=Leptomonas pyrrhocoris TaxID=157538 RepID=A0A0N0DXM4_LEPPY|nr:hypothetical protein ABB37_02851 [Leptomonas pyrrhocoris]KPA83155.1 hypothetical protein ABB37_02851 [Leptomonas pyrrhocoris]|eukprot:XP_015661594.1 hypothetical protein ABB37_02851 [Leptomonas pyrrhocoris]